MSEVNQNSAERRRARDMGIVIGSLPTGPHNAITDVAGVRVGHTTIISGEGPLVVGQGPVRTGVTVVLPHVGNVGQEPIFAGSHVLNGNGEMTGLVWLNDSGLLTSPVALTNTHSVGVAHDALIAHNVQHGSEDLSSSWSLPVVAETYDGFLSDINGFHVKQEHVFAALDAASAGAVAEGCVGGGTGMICHGFKGGIGTSSRVLAAEQGGWTVGVLVQANHGQRRLLRVDGVPVGQFIGPNKVPLPGQRVDGAGSIIVLVATDAPLLPGQCRRLAQRATIGIARTGGLGENGSGDIFLAWSTANRGRYHTSAPNNTPLDVQMLHNDALTPLFEAVADATEEAIVNVLCMATTTTGIDGRTAYAMRLDQLQALMERRRS